MFVSLVRACVVYVVKEVGQSGGLGQLMGLVCNRTHAQALQTSRKKAAWLYVETGTNSCSRYNIFLKFYKNL